MHEQHILKLLIQVSYNFRPNIKNLHANTSKEKRMDGLTDQETEAVTGTDFGIGDAD